ncbi:hypothetical protein CEXT_589601 [Caerostris extrusa]|uniref:Uncharacterized protein n=1 Tax=Caerostris extrusa TaxID=172846 RepID=A0AAV4QBM1_CAEEX|nr:hypothetical protein CEXT_589601 [Caerostris extrusa]
MDAIKRHKDMLKERLVVLIVLANNNATEYLAMKTNHPSWGLRHLVAISESLGPEWQTFHLRNSRTSSEKLKRGGGGEGVEQNGRPLKLTRREMKPEDFFPLLKSALPSMRRFTHRHPEEESLEMHLPNLIGDKSQKYLIPQMFEKEDKSNFPSPPSRNQSSILGAAPSGCHF